MYVPRYVDMYTYLYVLSYQLIIFIHDVVMVVIHMLGITTFIFTGFHAAR